MYRYEARSPIPIHPSSSQCKLACRTLRHVLVKVDIAGEAGRHESCKDTAGGDVVDIRGADEMSGVEHDGAEIDPEPAECSPCNCAQEAEYASFDLVEFGHAIVRLPGASADESEAE